MQNSTEKTQMLARLRARTERIPLEIRFSTGPDTDAPETELLECCTPVRFQQLSELENGDARIQIETTRTVQVPASGNVIARWLDLYAGDVELVRVDLAHLAHMLRSSGLGSPEIRVITFPEGALFTLDVGLS